MTSEDVPESGGIWDLVPFAGIYEAAPSSREVDEELSDAAFVSAVLAFESVVVSAQGSLGLLPAELAGGIAQEIENAAIDPWAVRQSMADHATPIIGILAQLREQLGPEAARHVHVGLTSQDCIDTAHALMQAGAIDHLEQLVGSLIESLALLAETAVAVPMLARTLGQPAAATTFGFKICGWITGLEHAYSALLETRGDLAVQLGGPVGDQRGLGADPGALVDRVAQTLGLSARRLPWHTERGGVLRAATSYLIAINACAKIATDLLAMSAAEVHEIAFGGDPEQAGRGGSSAMPHKRNPVAAVLIRSAATRAPGLLASVAASGVGLHERAAGEWQAEWSPLRELLHLAGGAAYELGRLLRDIRQVDTAAMLANLEAADVGHDTSAAVARAQEFLARFEDLYADDRTDDDPDGDAE